VIAITQVLGVGATTLVSHAAGGRIRIARIFLFNQSQVLSMVVAIAFLAVAMLTRHQYATEQSASEGMRIATEQYLQWFHSGDGAAVRDGRDGRGAARHRQFQAGHAGAVRHGRDQHGHGAVPDFRLGTVPRNGRQRRGGRDIHCRRHRRGVDFDLLHRRESLLAVQLRPLETAIQRVVGDAEDWSAGRRGVSR
jgi:hypothetical protein